MRATTLRRIAVLLSIAQIISGQDFSELENWSCTRPGLNPHPHDCHNFVICLSTQEGLKPESIFTCPDSFAFSQQEGTCVHKDKVPGCTQNRQGTNDLDDGFSKRGPAVGGSCKTNGVFCHNDNVLVVCTDTRVPVLVLDCRTLDETPICDTITGTCRAENLPDHITFVDTDVSSEEQEEVKVIEVKGDDEVTEDEVEVEEVKEQVNEGVKEFVQEVKDELKEIESEIKVQESTDAEVEEHGAQLENTEVVPASLSSTLANLIERVMGVFTRRNARLQNKN